MTQEDPMDPVWMTGALTLAGLGGVVAGSLVTALAIGVVVAAHNRKQSRKVARAESKVTPTDMYDFEQAESMGRDLDEVA